jgi:hypothetical protein
MDELSLPEVRCLVDAANASPLESAWPDFDRFEGPGYERILVPVFGTALGTDRSEKRRLRTVANLYAAAESGSGAGAFWSFAVAGTTGRLILAASAPCYADRSAYEVGLTSRS